jgi:hypothetical protein
MTEPPILCGFRVVFVYCSRFFPILCTIDFVQQMKYYFKKENLNNHKVTRRQPLMIEWGLLAQVASSIII